MRIRSAAFLYLAMMSACAAVEVPDPPPAYLGEKVRAEWRQKPLGEALGELEKWLEKPIARSDGVTKRLTERVALVDERKTTLRDTLETLERIKHLRFIAEPLRLRVETDDEARDRRRRLVDLSLRDYGMFFRARDFPGRELGWSASFPADGQGLHMFQNGDGASAPDPAEILDHLQKNTSHGTMELRGDGNIYLWVTPEEEAEVRRDLDELYHAATRRTDWRCVFGTLPAGDAPSGGIAARADAEALIARLKDARTLTLSSLNDERVNTGSEQLRAYLGDADVVSGHLDPSIRVLATGRAADLRAAPGYRFTWVGYQLAWADPLADPPPAQLRNPVAGHAGGEATVTLKKEDAGATTAAVSTPDATPRGGEAMAVAQPAVWLWSPRGECFMPKGSALVLVAEHGEDRAVIVLEETTP